MAQYSYAKLRGRIVEKYGSQEKFALKLGITPTALSRKMQGKSGFSQNDIVVWSELLSIDAEDYGNYFFT